MRGHHNPFIHDLTIVYSPPDTGWGTPSDPGGLSVTVQGLLQPADVRRQTVAAGSGLPIPSFQAFIPFSVADLSIPGWHIVYEGQPYYPAMDARNEGGQGIVWLVELHSPGQVTNGTP